MSLQRRHWLGLTLSVLALAACADEAPDATPATTALEVDGVMASKAASGEVAIGDAAVVSPVLSSMNADLAASGSKLRVAKAELIVDPKTWDGSSTILIAEDRIRGLGSEWVAGDPRRDGRVGVTYALDLAGARPVTRNPDGSGARLATFPELETQLEEGMAAWRGETCSDAPIDRVNFPVATVDPDLLDNLFNGRPEVAGRTYAQVSDIVQAGWQPGSFFTAFAGPAGNGIIGVAFTFIFTDDNGVPSDIDGDGNRDTGLVEIYYNTRFAWGNSGALNVIDYYSIITHETGHSLGLAHFGKVFVTRNDAADGIQLTDIKYAPLALMNAVYVTGRGEIRGTDRSSFCQVWASKN